MSAINNPPDGFQQTVGKPFFYEDVKQGVDFMWDNKVIHKELDEVVHYYAISIIWFLRSWFAVSSTRQNSFLPPQKIQTLDMLYIMQR